MASILTLDANTGSWNFELEPGDAFVPSEPPENQKVIWGSGDQVISLVDFDFNATFGPDFSGGGDPNFSGGANAILLTTGNELTGFELFGPWGWDVSIVFFEITLAPDFDLFDGFTGPADGLFNTTVGGSVQPLTVNVTPVPEPTSAALLFGAAGLLACRRRR